MISQNKIPIKRLVIKKGIATDQHGVTCNTTNVGSKFEENRSKPQF